MRNYCSFLISLLALAVSGTAATPVSFPAGIIPFTTIHYILGPDANGDRVAVGSMTLATYNTIRTLATSTSNQQFSDSTVQLAPGYFYSNVYLLTPIESAGNFSDFPMQIFDPASYELFGQQIPFAGNILPVPQAGVSDTGIFAFRLGPGLRFVPITPCRVVDTRNPAGVFGGPILAGTIPRDFPLQQGSCNIPTTAQAYSLNVTVVPPGVIGFLSVWPAGQPQPASSTLNSDGRVKANAAIVPAGSGGKVSVYSSHDTHVVLDINGYFVPATDPSALAYYPVTPCRVVDTRPSTGILSGPRLVGGATRTFPVLLSGCGIPATAQAYSLNFTAVPPGIIGFLTAWPAGQPQPNASILNTPPKGVTANAAILPAGSMGDISVYSSHDTDLVIDINGYFAPPGANGLSLYTLPPCRAADTRFSGAGNPLTGQYSFPFSTSVCNVPLSGQAYVVNATVVPSGPLGFLSLWPAGQVQPIASTLNSDGAVTSNMAIVPSGASTGSISVYASNPTQLILDISSYFAP